MATQPRRIANDDAAKPALHLVGSTALLVLLLGAFTLMDYSAGLFERDTPLAELIPNPPLQGRATFQIVQQGKPTGFMAIEIEQTDDEMIFSVSTRLAGSDQYVEVHADPQTYQPRYATSGVMVGMTFAIARTTYAPGEVVVEAREGESVRRAQERISPQATILDNGQLLAMLPYLRFLHGDEIRLALVTTTVPIVNRIRLRDRGYDPQRIGDRVYDCRRIDIVVGPQVQTAWITDSKPAHLLRYRNRDIEFIRMPNDDL